MSSNLLALIALLLMLSMLASVLTMVKERRKRLYREEHGQTYPHPELDNIPRLRFLRWVHGLLVVGHGAVLLGVVQLISFTIGIVLFLVLPWLVFWCCTRCCSGHPGITGRTCRIHRQTEAGLCMTGHRAACKSDTMGYRALNAD